MDKNRKVEFHRRRCRKSLQNVVQADCAAKQKAMVAQSADYILGECPDPIKEAREKRERERGFSVGRDERCMKA